MTYDLADNVLTKTRTNKPNSSTMHTINEIMDYDNALRLKRTKHQVDAMPAQTVSQMDYTIKNQVATKWMGQVGGLNFLQKVDYSYNSVGFLTGINSPNTNGPFTYVKALSSCTYPTAWYGSPTDYDFSDLFVETLTYKAPNTANAPTNTTVTGEYGGNITQMTWQTRLAIMSHRSIQLSNSINPEIIAATILSII